MTKTRFSANICKKVCSSDGNDVYVNVKYEKAKRDETELHQKLPGIALLCIVKAVELLKSGKEEVWF